jgi:hypothetical protein
MQKMYMAVNTIYTIIKGNAQFLSFKVNTGTFIPTSLSLCHCQILGPPFKNTNTFINS